MQVIQTTGKRKTSVAKALIRPGEGKVTVNQRSFDTYFPNTNDQRAILLPLTLTDQEGKFDIIISVFGGGITGQKEAMRLAISRGMVALEPSNRTILKPKKLLTRDRRRVERKKYGQPKARKQSPFRKR